MAIVGIFSRLPQNPAVKAAFESRVWTISGAIRRRIPGYRKLAGGKNGVSDFHVCVSMPCATATCSMRPPGLQRRACFAPLRSSSFIRSTHGTRNETLAFSI